jgi:crotonobetainyl-CoA:carnitine CoA-transferase CaiB-like acyl-CoA transferase
VIGTFLGRTLHSVRGDPEVTASPRRVEVPSIEPTADGLVGFHVVPRHHFDNFLILIERPDLIGDEEWAVGDRRAARADEWNEIVRSWTTKHTTAEIIERARLLGIPVSPVLDGQGVLDHDQFVARQIYTESSLTGVRYPLPWYQLDGVRPHAIEPAPALGAHTGAIEPRRVVVPDVTGPLQRPLEGVRILDATAYWAGPYAAQILAGLGADVIHLESPSHIDGGRLASSASLAPRPAFWECGWLWLAANTDKRSITIDLSDASGRGIFTELVRHSDAVIENFAPRVFDSFWLGFDEIRSANPTASFVRMPAFGLDGPWRDNVAFASTVAQCSGMAWLTGLEDDLPIAPGVGDPIAGVHGAFATLVALHHRDGTGVGCFVESTMVEAALGVAAEQVIAYSGHGVRQRRHGNRDDGRAIQGVFPTAEHEVWLAVAVTSAKQWTALVAVLGLPEWATDPEVVAAAAELRSHDVIDDGIATWSWDRRGEESHATLRAAGVPAAIVSDPRFIERNPQVGARGLVEIVDHELAGPYAVAVMPVRLASVARWWRHGAPLFGANNAAILGGLAGVDPAELARLEAAGIVGRRPHGVD